MDKLNLNRLVGVIRESDLEDKAAELIGVSLAFALPTPTKAEENLFAFWSNNLLLGSNKYINDLSEKQAFNQVAAAEICKEVYLYRVKSFFTPQYECPEILAKLVPEWQLPLAELIRLFRIEIARGF
jgi:hypothetical protein